ncbi:hypothetical protein CIL05_20500 [Virgibacillus profundi]|uniref:Uncharacterized protein n=1 Tax=Virgibacillus profundi TaxID=2024555 RepID=A0A2A2I7M6_9BACI|nr:hypothetical protein CIL05_20500 [Virgibacillus profundi]PXY51884.1 hypothetical protein CIT14_20720 [Virgibacillus profundi]
MDSVRSAKNRQEYCGYLPENWIYHPERKYIARSMNLSSGEKIYRPEHEFIIRRENISPAALIYLLEKEYIIRSAIISIEERAH